MTNQRRERLKLLIADAFTISDETYGYRRIHAQLARWGVPCGPELVRSIMRELDLQPCQPRPWRFNLTEQDDREHRIPDLLEQDFTTDAPGKKLIGDITYYVELLIMSTSVRSVLVSGVCRANLVGIIPAALGWRRWRTSAHGPYARERRDHSAVEPAHPYLPGHRPALEEHGRTGLPRADGCPARSSPSGQPQASSEHRDYADRSNPVTLADQLRPDEVCIIRRWAK